jgi:hypothetical protein
MPLEAYADGACAYLRAVANGYAAAPKRKRLNLFCHDRVAIGWNTTSEIRQKKSVKVRNEIAILCSADQRNASVGSYDPADLGR